MLLIHFKLHDLCSILYSDNLLHDLSGKLRCNSPVGWDK